MDRLEKGRRRQRNQAPAPCRPQRPYQDGGCGGEGDLCRHALRAEDHAAMRDLVSSETALPRQGQQVRPHAPSPAAGDDATTASTVIGPMRIKWATTRILVAPKTLEHMHTLKLFIKTKDLLP